MRVLLVSREFPPAIRGGQGTVVMQLVSHLANNGQIIDLVIPIQPTEPKLGQNVHVHQVPMVGGSFITRTISFYVLSRKIIRDLSRQTDVIYSHGTLINSRSDIPIVSHFHTSRYGEAKACLRINKPIHALINWMCIILDKWIVRQSDTIIVLTPEMAADIKKDVVICSPIAIIENGIDVNSIVKATSQGNVAQNSALHILYYGRLDPRKRVDLLLRAVAVSSVTAKIQITGEGPEEARLRRLTRKLGLDVTFTRLLPREEVFRSFESNDLVVLPSTYEGFPMTTLECMSAGIPIITSDACPDLGQTRFKKDDIKSLAKVLNQFGEDKKAELRKAQAFRNTVERYNLTVMADKILKVLSDCVDTARQRNK